MAHNSNPYALAGFGEGFMRGLDIVYRKQDRDEQRADRQVQRERSDKEWSYKEKELEGQAEERGLRMQEHKLRVSEAEAAAASRETPEEAKARRKREATLQNQSIDVNAYNTKRKKEEDFYSDQEKLYNITDSLLSTLPRTIAQNPDWGQRGQALYGAYKSGEILSNPQIYQEAINWFGQTYDGVIKQGIGAKISDRTAKEQGVQPGSVIIGKRLKSIHVDKDTKDVVLVLEITVEKDGKQEVYNAPWTKDRSDSPEDEILVLRPQNFENMLKGGAAFEAGLARAEKQGIPRDRALAMIEGTKIDRAERRLNQPTRQAAKVQEVRQIADALFDGDEGQARLYLDGVIKTRDRTAIAKLLMENSSTELTPEEAFARADQLLGVEDESTGGTGGPKKIKYNSDGSFVVEGSAAPTKEEEKKPEEKGQSSEGIFTTLGKGIDTRTPQEKLRDKIKKNKLTLGKLPEGKVK